jgi:hypothetical protein
MVFWSTSPASQLVSIGNIMESELILSQGGLPPLSARGCVQELTLLSLGQFRRTVNGELVFLGLNHKKYRSVIICEDQAVLATDDLLPGTELEVHCIQRLWQKSDSWQLVLEREPVQGSVFAVDQAKQPVLVVRENGKEVTLENEGLAYVCYRPKLRMRVLHYALKTNEWGLKTSWRLELEEI